MGGGKAFLCGRAKKKKVKRRMSLAIIEPFRGLGEKQFFTCAEVATESSVDGEKGTGWGFEKM